MKKKIYLSLIAVLLLIAISVPAAFAAQSENPAPAPGVNSQVNLSDAQKSDLKQLFDKMVELRKQIVQKYVDTGALYQEDADYRLNRMQEMQKYREQNGFVPGMVRGFGGRWMQGNTATQ